MKTQDHNLTIEQMFLNFPCSLWWMNRNHINLGCNIECCGLVKLNPQEILGKTLIDITKDVDSFLLKSLTEEIYDMEERIMKTGVPEFQNLHIIPQGPGEKPIRQLLAKKPILNAKGEVIGLLAAGILERQYDQQFKVKVDNFSEDRFIIKDQTVNVGFREAFQMMPCSLFWMDKEHRYLGCNQENCRVLGIYSQRELIGKTILEVAKIKRWPSMRAENIYDLDESIMHTGISEYSIENITPQGEKVPALRQIVAKKPIFDSKGDVIGLMGAAIYDGRFGEQSRWSSLG